MQYGVLLSPKLKQLFCLRTRLWIALALREFSFSKRFNGGHWYTTHSQTTAFCSYANQYCIYFVKTCLQGFQMPLNEKLTTETGRQFFGDARNSCRWRERRMFWVTWQNAREHIPSRCVAQFFLRASSQSSIFSFRCACNMIRIKFVVYAFHTDKKPSISTYGKPAIATDFWLASGT